MSGTLTSRFSVVNLDRWGCLVKSWATHEDYISQPYPAQPPRDFWVNQTWPTEAGRKPAPATLPDTNASGTPQQWALPNMVSFNVPRADGTNVALNAVVLSVDDFKNRVGAAGVTIANMPAAYTNVIIVQGNPHTMVLRLPPTDTLQSSEDDLLNGNGYSFAPFYGQYYPCTPNMPAATDTAGIMKLHAYRIGEYTLNSCT